MFLSFRANWSRSTVRPGIGQSLCYGCRPSGRPTKSSQKMRRRHWPWLPVWRCRSDWKAHPSEQWSGFCRYGRYQDDKIDRSPETTASSLDELFWPAFERVGADWLSKKVLERGNTACLDDSGLTRILLWNSPEFQLLHKDFACNRDWRRYNVRASGPDSHLT